uniref:Zinc finger, CCHC-type n=1 Tax=Tanacetum cinerariifolium TaxID=118510 RepID=A0A6L2JHJ9_TANCI|nr:hypothetical protein [Tanacetum cinerariifolium]
MAATIQNTNNTTLRSILLANKLTGSNFTNWYRNLRIALKYEKKIQFVKQLIGPAPDPETADPKTMRMSILSRMLHALCCQEAIHACKQEEGQSVSSYLLKMKSYLDTLERLGYAMPDELGEGKIQKDRNKLQRAKGKDKGKTNLLMLPRPRPHRHL